MTDTDSLPTPPGTDQMHLALERTYLAYERTLMAWVRTATSMITFGFTLYKFFHYMKEQEPHPGPQPLFGARTFGLLMIGFGVFALAVAAWQHRQQTRMLRIQYKDAPRSLAAVLATLMATLGIFAFVSALFRQ